MDTVFGVLAFVAYIVCVIGVAAGVTWVVVRLTPKKKTPDATPKA